MQLNRLSRALGAAQIVGGEDEEADRVVKSAGRVLKILELFDILKREALVSEVSGLLGLPQSSTSVLLRSMVVLGYLYFNPETRAFGPTTRVALLGSWINGPLLNDGPLMRLMEGVNQRTGQAVVLAVRNRIWAQYIHVVQATDPLRMFVVKGARRPLVRSGTGLALLADLPDSDIKRIALRCNAEAQDNEPQVCIAELMKQIEEIRECGWAATFDTITRGGGMLATRLPQLENEERIVIGVCGASPVLRESLDTFILVLHEEIAKHITGREPVKLQTAA